MVLGSIKASVGVGMSVVYWELAESVGTQRPERV